MPGSKDMDVWRARRIVQKWDHYDDLLRRRAIDILLKEVKANMAETVQPDIELIWLNGSWYGTTENGLEPIDKVISKLKDLKIPDGGSIRIRVLKSPPKES